MIRLVLPNIKYKNSFLESLTEPDKDSAFFPIGHREYKGGDFSVFVKKIRDFAKGIGLKKGYVPETVFWLVDTTKNEYIGFVTVRHRLNNYLKREGGNIGYFIRPSKRGHGNGTLQLKMALKKAKLLGIKEIILTCNKKNIPSQKVIEKNHGVFFSEIYIPEKKARKLRFKIEL